MSKYIEKSPFQLNLQQLNLKNFRGFADVRLDLNPELTVLIGSNGSGKSTILDAIANLLQVYVQKLHHPVLANDFLLSIFNDDDIKNDAISEGANCRLLAELSFESIEAEKAQEEDEEDEIDISTARRDDTISYINWAVALKKKNYKIEDFDELIDLDTFYNSVQLKLKHNEPFGLPLVVYYPLDDATSSLRRTKQEGLNQDTVFSAFEDALSRKSFNYQAFFEWFRWQENLARQTEDKFLLNTVCEAIYGVFNDKKRGEEARDEKASFTNLHVDWMGMKQGELRIQKEEQNLKVTQLSSGEKSLLLLVADLARRLALANPNLKNPLTGNGIVLIDEIDLHLHPKWQRKIITQLLKTFPNCQFIVTTHSAEVLKGVDKEHLRILKNGEVIHIPPYIKGRDSNSILEDAFGLPKRTVEYEGKLNKFYELVESNKSGAREVLDDLIKDWGETDEEIIRAESYYEIF